MYFKHECTRHSMVRNSMESDPLKKRLTVTLVIAGLVVAGSAYGWEVTTALGKTDGRPSCEIALSVGERSNAGLVYDYVERSLSFSNNRFSPYGDASAKIRFDRGEPIDAPGSSKGGFLLITDPEVLDPMLGQMRSGRLMRVELNGELLRFELPGLGFAEDRCRRYLEENQR